MPNFRFLKYSKFLQEGGGTSRENSFKGVLSGFTILHQDCLGNENEFRYMGMIGVISEVHGNFV